MNILELTDFHPDYPGNFGYTLIKIAEFGEKQGYNTYFVFPLKRKWHEDFEKYGGKVFYIPHYKFRQKIIDFSGFKKIWRIVNGNNINIVHVHFGLSQKIITILLKIFAPNLKVVWHWRGDIEITKTIKVFFIKIFYRFFCNYVIDKHISNSFHITTRIIDANLVSKTKLYTLPNAVNLDMFINDRYLELIKNIKQKYGLNNKFVLIMVRNFRSSVDFEIILQTMVKLRNYSDIVLLWLGCGETFEIIKNKVKETGLSNVLFLGKKKNPIPYYYSSHLNIISWEPWCNETINNTVYEALGCGIPVIGLNFGGLPMAFSKEEGVFSVPLDPQKYAEKILEIKNNYHIVLKNVNKGLIKVKNQYSLGAYVECLYKIYKDK